MKLSRRQRGKHLLAGAAGTLVATTPSAFGAEDAPEERIKTKVCVIGGGSGGARGKPTRF